VERAARLKKRRNQRERCMVKALFYGFRVIRKPAASREGSRTRRGS
jgi:hypothetical protein